MKFRRRIFQWKTQLYEIILGGQTDNSRSDNSSRIRHVQLDKQRQFLQTFEISSQPLADSENNKSPTIDKNNSSLAPVTDIKMNTPKFAAASDLSAFQRDQHVRCKALLWTSKRCAYLKFRRHKDHLRQN